jgi:Aldo/keto reductase family
MLSIEANGARIPAIGLGTWDLRGRACARIVEQALRLGYRHIDTAQMYENEREVGEGLRASAVKREQVFVTTKIWPTHFAPHDLERSVKESLVRLRLTEINLLLLHWPNPQVPLVETLGALARVKQQGLARHIGVSNFTVALIEEAVAICPEPLVCDQVEYHPYLDQAKVKEACARHGMALVARPRPHQERGHAAADRRTPSQDGGAGLPALAGAAGRGGNSAHLETRAAFREHRDLRFRTVGRRDAGDFRPGQRRRPAAGLRLRAEMGLSSCADGRHAGGSLPPRKFNGPKAVSPIAATGAPS